jgi:hypothetical protein
MVDLEGGMELTEGYHAQFTQAGSMQDLSLNQLRDHIKRVMIPLLIKSFQLKLELSQAISLPSRLQVSRLKHSSEEIIEQLKQMDKDLQVLLLWGQSCRNQIQKALVLPEEEIKSLATSKAASAIHPAVTKSFTEALGECFSRRAKLDTAQHQAAPLIPQENEESRPKRKWWKVFLN